MLIDLIVLHRGVPRVAAANLFSQPRLRVSPQPRARLRRLRPRSHLPPYLPSSSFDLIRVCFPSLRVVLSQPIRFVVLRALRRLPRAVPPVVLVVQLRPRQPRPSSIVDPRHRRDQHAQRLPRARRALERAERRASLARVVDVSHEIFLYSVRRRVRERRERRASHRRRRST